MNSIISLPTARCALVALGLVAVSAFAQEIQPTNGIAFPEAGTLKPRAASEIKSSWWSIGGETIDRDFTVYENYKRHLGPLGAKGIRLQAGWAKCEKKPGVYDFTWLDAIVDDARRQGVQPWLELSYGNKVYAGGGDIGLGGGFPSSPEALAAWDRWVTAIVTHFKDRVWEWEIWNEPDLNRTGTAKAPAYIDLHIRSATIIRSLQPKSKIYAMGLAHTIEYADEVITGLQARGKLDLVDAVTYHGYPQNPDDTSFADKLFAIIKKTGRSIQVRQGETGAPSKFQENFALSKQPWSETTQAKWDIRRLLAHRAKDVPMNLFTISDMHYRNPDGSNLRMNYKGMLGTNPDQTISHVKAAYRAAQSVFTLFDDSVTRVADADVKATVPAPHALAATVYAQRGGAGERYLVPVWLTGAKPVDDNEAVAVDVTVRGAKFTAPVVVDLRTGKVYRIPAERWRATNGGAEFKGLPLYDSPMLIAEAAVVPLQ